MDEELAAAILKASRHSMGMDASPVDMSNIVTFSERMVKLAEYRRDLYAYLVDKVRRSLQALSAFRSLSCAFRRLTWTKLLMTMFFLLQQSRVYHADGHRCPQPGGADRRYGWSAFDFEGGLVDVVGEVPRVNGADPRR